MHGFSYLNYVFTNDFKFFDKNDDPLLFPALNPESSAFQLDGSQLPMNICLTRADN